MTLATITLIIIIAALAIYLVFGGADFGVGIWEAATAFRSNKKQTELSYHAIGPVWETNHVWLIFILVLLFGAFPKAFAVLNEALFVPLFLALIGIVFRGAAYAFRSQLISFPRQRRIWESVFAIASITTPLFLGASIGALASGELELGPEGEFTGKHLTNWLNPLSIFMGLFTVGLCTYSSAVLLLREASIANDGPLIKIWKRRALLTGIALGIIAIGGLVLVAVRYPELWRGMLGGGWILVAISVVVGILSLLFIYQDKVNLAALGVAVTCSSVVFGWGVSQYPFLIPGFWTIENARSPDSVLMIILIVTAIGAAILIPSLYLLFAIFKSEKAKH